MKSLEERFWNKVRKSDGCWNWSGCLDSKGYGRIIGKLNGKWEVLYAHRLSWELANKQSFPDNLESCHVCNNRKCVNPAHIYAGTTAQNTADAIKAGTFPGFLREWKRGEDWEKFRVMQYPEYVQQLCGMIADHFRKESLQLVAGPTTAGIILAFEVARQIGVRAIYAEKAENKTFAFKRGAAINPGDRVLVVDDVLTTGGSIKEVIAAVKERQGIVIGVGVLVDRTEQKIDFGVPLFACHRAEAVS